jgi:hypothetical protein
LLEIKTMVGMAAADRSRAVEYGSSPIGGLPRKGERDLKKTLFEHGLGHILLAAKLILRQ